MQRLRPLEIGRHRMRGGETRRKGGEFDGSLENGSSGSETVCNDNCSGLRSCPLLISESDFLSRCTRYRTMIFLALFESIRWNQSAKTPGATSRSRHQKISFITFIDTFHILERELGIVQSYKNILKNWAPLQKVLFFCLEDFL